MSYFIWHNRWDDEPHRKVIRQADLYYYHCDDAEYDGDNSTMNLVGAFRRKDDQFLAYVAYSMAPTKSESRFYKDQTETRQIGMFATAEEAAAAIQERASVYFTSLAEMVVQCSL